VCVFLFNSNALFRSTPIVFSRILFPFAFFYYLFFHFLSVNALCAYVGRVITLQVRQSRNRGLLPGRVNKYLSSPKLPDRLWGPPTHSNLSVQSFSTALQFRSSTQLVYTKCSHLSSGAVGRVATSKWYQPDATGWRRNEPQSVLQKAPSLNPRHLQQMLPTFPTTRNVKNKKGETPATFSSLAYSADWS